MSENFANASVYKLIQLDFFKKGFSLRTHSTKMIKQKLVIGNRNIYAQYKWSVDNPQAFKSNVLNFQMN